MATIQLTLLQQAGEPVGDGGDQYVGLDRFGRLVDQRWLDGTGADVERVQYGYDRASNRVWRANPVATAAGAAQDEFYVHDGLQQLSVRQQGVLNADRTGISGTPAAEEDLTYDPLGNWSEYVVQAGGGTTLDQTRTHNVDNEITTLAGDDSLLGYDQAGNMTTCPQPADGTSADALTWDAWNRLVAVESVAQVAGNSFTSACLYDGLTRRVSKTITVRTGHTATVTARNYFYSDQWKVLQDQTTARRPQQPDQRQFVWRGCAEDKLILRDQGGAAVSPRLFALDDGKNVSAVCDESGAVAERYGYSGFGAPVFMDAGFTAQDGSNYDWETLFCGYRFDADTGLYQVRYRFLHPQLGRWLSRDPFGDIEFKARLKLFIDIPPNKTVAIAIIALAKLSRIKRLYDRVRSDWKLHDNGLHWGAYSNDWSRVFRIDLVSEIDLVLQSNVNNYLYAVNSPVSFVDSLGLLRECTTDDRNYQGKIGGYIECKAGKAVPVVTDNPRNYGKIAECKKAHEQKHADDYGNDYCKGKPDGSRPCYSDKDEAKKYECPAYEIEVNCELRCMDSRVRDYARKVEDTAKQIYGCKNF